MYVLIFRYVSELEITQRSGIKLNGALRAPDAIVEFIAFSGDGLHMATVITIYLFYKTIGRFEKSR
jgi:hypothetical protein